MSKLHVLLLSDGLSPRMGGSAVSEASLVKTLQNYCEVQVLSVAKRTEHEFLRRYELMDVILFSPVSFLLAWIFKGHWMNQVLSRVDLLHLNGHWRWHSFFLVKLCERFQVPYVLQPRGMLLLGHRRVRLKRLFNLIIGNKIIRSASKLIALSKFETTQFLPYGIPENKILILPNGITVPKSAGDATPFPEKSYFLYLGRLESRKNLVFLLEAFKSYVENGGKKRLLLMGPVERRYDQILKNRIGELELEKWAQILPPVYEREKWAYLRNALAVVYPTIDEPFGRVPFEALAVGVPPVIPSSSGAAEYLSSLLPDSIYKSEDADSLAAILGKAESLSQSAIERASHWVIHDLDWSKLVHRILDCYSEIGYRVRSLPPSKGICAPVVFEK